MPVERPHEQHLGYILGWLLLAIWASVELLFVFFGTYAGDEGWYTLISREVFRGRLLYRDLRFTQMPLLPYLYGLVFQLLPGRIESLRLASGLFAFSGLIAVWQVAVRRYGAWAALLVLAVLVLDRGFAYHVSNVKTQGLTFALAAWSLWFADRGACSHRGWLLAGIFAGLALLTRLSCLPFALLLPFLGAAAVPRGERLRCAVTAAIGAVAVPALIAAVFCLAAGHNFFFGIYGFHASIAATSPLSCTSEFLGFWKQFIQQQPMGILCMLAGTGAACWLAFVRKHVPLFEVFFIVVWIGITAIHATRRPSYAVYQVPLAWAPALLAGFVAAQLKSRPAWAKAFAAAVCLGAAVAIPFQEGSFHFRSDYRTPAGLYRLAEPIRKAGKVKLVTLDAGFAVCAPDAILLPGYEMSEFSFIPYASPAEQKRLNGISPEQMIEDLTKTADVAVLRRADLRLIPRRMRSGVQQAAANFGAVVAQGPYGQFADMVQIAVREKR